MSRANDPNAPVLPRGADEHPPREHDAALAAAIPDAPHVRTAVAPGEVADPPAPPPVAPRATYRLQFHGGFRLDDARALVPYLAALGVSHLYASPLLRARSGSTHGYDVVDPTQIDPERGSERDLAALVRELRAHGMGLVLDIVPNHMAASQENPAWDELLAHGRAARHARWFDVDWYAPDEELSGRILVAVLGRPRREAIDAGEITLERRGGTVRVRYYQQSFPVDPRTLPRVWERARLDAAGQLGEAHPDVRALGALLGALRALPPRQTRDNAVADRRRAEAHRLTTEVARLAEASPVLAGALDRAAATFGAGDDGRERLRRLLEAQGYALAYWRRAAREINYRRFFNIDELIALRAEREWVFDETHAAVLAWVKGGIVDGLRVDHVDGLRDPRGYLDRLAEAADGRRGAVVPVWVEKILAEGESLRDEWPVAGTTGYEALNELESLFVDPDGERRIAEWYAGWIAPAPGAPPFHDVARDAKRQVLATSLAADLGRVARLLERWTQLAADPGRTPPARPLLETALAEVIVALDVYRPYLRPGELPHPEDRRWLGAAFAGARAAGRADPAALALLDVALFGRDAAEVQAPDDEAGEAERARRRFVSRFQQLTSPAAAKGVEDTALYRRYPIASLAEVGGEPDRPLADAVAHFHAANAHRAARWPRALLTVSTHDTKRSADARARLSPLADESDAWITAVRRWHQAADRFRGRAGRRRVPDANTEYLLWQTLVGIWPVDAPRDAAGLPVADALVEVRERAQAYLRKAIREGRVRSSWVAPDEEWERALDAFIAALLDPATPGTPLADLDAVARRAARHGWWTSLARTLLQYTMPGVPDLYQGDEMWALSLVDPDNRRPVDFVARAVALQELERAWHAGGATRASLLRALVASPADGRLKLHLIRRALAVRAEQPAVFDGGAYVPLEVRGAQCDRLVAFARLHPAGASRGAVVALAPRLVGALPGASAPDFVPAGGCWGDTAVVLPESLRMFGWHGALSGRELAPAPALPIAGIEDSLPVALLVARPA